MELAEVVNTQYAFPVGIVLICAVFVFAFGFKASNPPTFSQLVHAADERKTAGKKRKLKDKKSVQSNLSSPIANDEGRKQKSDNSSKVLVGKAFKQSKNAKDEAEKGPLVSNKQQKKKNVSQKENVNESVLVEGKNTTKDGKQSPEVKKKIQSGKDASGEPKNKSQEKRLLKEKNYNIQQVKTKTDAKPKSSKSSKLKLNEEKPVDFDDGEWEQAISRKEKKSKKKDEEALMAANALNSAMGSPSLKQSLVIAPNNDSVDLSATAGVADMHNHIHRSGASNDIPASIDSAALDSDISDAVLGNTVAGDRRLLSGEIEKQESTTKAASASPSAPNEKVKSSKSKGKNKEPTLSLQKESSTTQENENITAVSVQPPTEEVAKPKKKKKQSNAADNKEGKTPTQPVEVPKPHSVEVEIPNGEGDLSVAHDIIADTKIEPQAAVVFDELGDVWKEAKAPKKNKKKVRKDQ